MPLSEVLDHISPLFVEFDRDWRYVFVNARAAEALGRKREELIGRIVWEAFPEVVGSEMDRQIRRAAEERRTVQFTHLSPVFNRWIEIQAIPTENGVCIFSQDVSKHKEAEEEVLRLNRDLLRRIDELQALLAVAPVGIAVADDPECRQIRLNPAGAAMLGVTTSENVSKSGADSESLPFKVLQNGRELQPDELPMQVAAARNSQVRDVEIEVVHNDGRVVNLFEYASPLLDEQGKIRGCLGLFVDITERKRAEQQFQAIYQLTSTVAHAEHIEEVFSATLDTLERGLNATRAAISLIDNEDR